MAELTFYACQRLHCPVCNRLLAAFVRAGHIVSMHRGSYTTPTRIEVLCEGVVYDEIPQMIARFIGEDIYFADFQEEMIGMIRFLDVVDEGLPDLP